MMPFWGEDLATLRAEALNLVSELSTAKAWVGLAETKSRRTLY